MSAIDRQVIDWGGYTRMGSNSRHFRAYRTSGDVWPTASSVISLVPTSTTGVRMRVIRLLVALAVLAAPNLAVAQAGAISGRVTEAVSGLPVSGAHVDALGSANKGRSATTRDDGSYAIADLTPDTYLLVVTRIGHQRRRVAG